MSPQRHPLALEWHSEATTGPAEYPTGEAQKEQKLGKRTVSFVETEEAASSQGADVASSSSTGPAVKRSKKIHKDLWPVEWQELYAEFVADTRDVNHRHEVWKRWPRGLKAQAYYRVSAGVRQLLERWEAEEAARSPPQPEATSHDWKEGCRIGEASNPGPEGRKGQWVHNPTGSRVPGWSRINEQAVAGRHGGRQLPKPTSSSSSSLKYPMINQHIGTPGNDGLLSAEDLRPGWPAGSQPESRQPTRDGSSGVPVDHRQGVGRPHPSIRPHPGREPGYWKKSNKFRNSYSS